MDRGKFISGSSTEYELYGQQQTLRKNRIANILINNENLSNQ